MRGYEYMLEIKKTAIALDEAELMELERIITDNEEQSALRFLKAIYARLVHSQQGKLKSHLDTGDNTVDRFQKANK